MHCTNYYRWCYSRLAAAYIELRCPVLPSSWHNSVVHDVRTAGRRFRTLFEIGTASSITLLGSTVAVL